MVELTSVQKKTVEFILIHIETTGMPPTLREIAGHFQWKAVGSAQDVVAALRKKGILLSPAAGKARQIVPSPEIFSGLFPPEQELLAMNTAKRKSNAKKSLKIPEQPVVKLTQNECLLPGFEDFLRVPLLGSIAAGKPTEALSQSDDFAVFPPVSRSALKGGPLFALRVDGYSMLLAGFLPGDTILVESTPSALDRDIIVANVENNEVTVKRFAQKGSTLYQQAQERLPTKSTPPAFLMPENPEFEPIPFGLVEEDKILGVVRSLFRKSIH